MSEELKGQVQDANGYCYCQRCGKKMKAVNFYSYRDGSKLQMCKQCLTAHVDNFDPDSFMWILEKIDVPYIPVEWNKLRDRAFAKNPKKINGMSVIGKYLAKMRIKQWLKYRFADTEQLQKEMQQNQQRQRKAQEEEKERYQVQLKTKLNDGKITLAEYQTLVSTETQYRAMERQSFGDPVIGENSYSQNANPFQEQNFLSENDLADFETNLPHQDKVYLALKWGRLYRPSQWIALEQLYNEFMESFDIQGAARIDTLKMICKTSLKMNQAIDIGDIESYQKLSRVYDTMMKSAKFTEAQNREKEDGGINSISALVDWVEANEGAIPKYECTQPQDLIDEIILDLKAYNKSLIYEDKSLAQEIEKYLQDKRIADSMKKDKKEAKKNGLSQVQLEDEDFVDYKESIRKMKEHDLSLDDEKIEKEYEDRRIQH